MLAFAYCLADTSLALALTWHCIKVRQTPLNFLIVECPHCVRGGCLMLIFCEHFHFLVASFLSALVGYLCAYFTSLLPRRSHPRSTQLLE